MTEWGYVKISRKFFADERWWHPKRAATPTEAWLDCIQMAAWKPRAYSIGQDVELLERGEFQASIRFLAKHWRWGKHSVERWITEAQKRGQLQRQREGQGGTVYLLVNYERYQGVEEINGDTFGDRNGDKAGTPRGHLGDKTEAVKAGKQVKNNNGRHSREPGKQPWLTPFSDLWTTGVPPYGQLAKALRPLTTDHDQAEVLDHWRRYLSQTEPRYWSPHRFASTYSAWNANQPIPGIADEPNIQWVD